MTGTIYSPLCCFKSLWFVLTQIDSWGKFSLKTEKERQCNGGGDAMWVLCYFILSCLASSDILLPCTLGWPRTHYSPEWPKTCAITTLTSVSQNAEISYTSQHTKLSKYF